ncbi:hypothetical protein SFC79_11285 [Nocardioides sp. S-58]|uniref:Uncharacterized protein n=1 Tax=Nocardioides renjunii TaxID=3095075 RepID=A0ABU5KBV2_9ACTN|nr:hypothetical protein [Nocardioides sp. S-58]MDZ5662348.1 hypothetical protein [Nocardioides sp. S-58]
MMLYRMAPHSPLEWTTFPSRDLKDDVAKYNLDLDRLEWQQTEERVFSDDLLRIALRHGVASQHALVVEAGHTVELGRSDTLRAHGLQSGELQADIRAKHGALMEGLMPGWTASGEELDERVRESTDRAAREADDELAEVLAAPVDPALAEHWTYLGGRLPEPV